MSGTIDDREIERFNALAEAWWDVEGDFRPLHMFNPVRLAYIGDKLAAHFGRNTDDSNPLTGLGLLDVGCGGGLICEPMVRLGANVTGIDAGEKNIQIAAAHAKSNGLSIDYRQTSVEALAKGKERFDVILNMEVIEHVADRDLFIRSCCSLLKPDGVMILATLNRTAKSFALAIIGAEYILRWLPPGTHQWDKFVKPSEIAAALRKNGFKIDDITGAAYNPITGSWRLSHDVGVNYMVLATRENGQ
ncbi:MAG: bifunctional 2-polyprenyl-6-hydroxyphenol methylase/3-demethylubiquinol 3-O-methyltransferase UbiG [Rhodospirillaceae bacterium]|jgi:2-polyprenyl-6-hydroxyphenyl methylase / 3-demethylubiquinone-9 3-methyltransferase|nr:bifunctional 2-polyprenyl-6-hydroxyphenol methylase/3-demethylubiquinol 3-O-methyltransferase UbiG [Rhodospirillaceae bacterium]MBT5373484.1 bifunctional 2-polyprenyl-6-hydroxyphenol methylase/3-demethylubiquinol 3-O-methyltransferase UbiG [Rhodospirillaceae bacterium]MBT7942955.1 bifunctional 2-polyprenyl-6-hydroxyphenol methylase/3-demethylubiquinol 3-O-methyltransferase UbiG [Alphaproteobacteria bacterium]